MSRITNTQDILNTVSQSRSNGLNFENRLQITETTTFVVPRNAKAVKFSVVGGGQPGSGLTAGPGAGYFEKTVYAPFVGLTTSFVLTVAAAGGNSTLGNSAGTVLATAFGASAIGAGSSIGIGGTASGGDINSNGSPGGTSPGVGGASGSPFGAGQYNPTYAGRWLYFKESFLNDNVKIFLSTNAVAAGATNVSIPSVGYGGSGIGGSLTLGGGPGGIAGDGGFGGGGNPSSPPIIGGPGGPGGFGGAGGAGGPGASPISPYGTGGAGGSGGAGGFGGAGGTGGRGGSPGGSGGAGGPGGFGGGGGIGGLNSPGSTRGPGGSGGFGGGGGSSNPSPFNGGGGGPGAFIVEWTTQVPNKIGV